MARCAGLNPVLSPDARAYRSIDPLETRGSDLYKATAPPGRNGFLGNNGNGNRIAGDTQFLYSNWRDSQPDGSGQGEWCTVLTATLTNTFTPNVRGWNDLPETYNYEFMCMDIPGGWCARSGRRAGRTHVQCATSWAAHVAALCRLLTCCWQAVQISTGAQMLAMHTACSPRPLWLALPWRHVAVTCAGLGMEHVANIAAPAGWERLEALVSAYAPAGCDQHLAASTLRCDAARPCQLGSS